METSSHSEPANSGTLLSRHQGLMVTLCHFQDTFANAATTQFLDHIADKTCSQFSRFFDSPCPFSFPCQKTVMVWVSIEMSASGYETGSYDYQWVCEVLQQHWQHVTNLGAKIYQQATLEVSPTGSHLVLVSRLDQGVLFSTFYWCSR
jgi:hypothetical protein